MHAEHVAEPTEFGASFVNAAEAEGPEGGRVVDVFQFAVGFQNVQDGTVRLPEEF